LSVSPLQKMNCGSLKRKTAILIEFCVNFGTARKPFFTLPGNGNGARNWWKGAVNQGRGKVPPSGPSLVCLGMGWNS
jgi:hypothetical protein